MWIAQGWGGVHPGLCWTAFTKRPPAHGIMHCHGKGGSSHPRADAVIWCYLGAQVGPAAVALAPPGPRRATWRGLLPNTQGEEWE